MNNCGGIFQFNMNLTDFLLESLYMCNVNSVKKQTSCSSVSRLHFKLPRLSFLIADSHHQISSLTRTWIEPLTINTSIR